MHVYVCLWHKKILPKDEKIKSPLKPASLTQLITLFEKDRLFLEQLYVHGNIEQKVQRFPIYLYPHTQPPPSAASPRGVHLL